MAEVLVEFVEPVSSEDGTYYTARACGSDMPGGQMAGMDRVRAARRGDPIRSPRETTQPNRQDTDYWATGLDAGVSRGRASPSLKRPARPLARDIAAPLFERPADNFIMGPPVTESILDPFSVYRKGEALLRRQLSAMAGWHLVNIITHYGLSREDTALLSAREPVQLVELIIDAVRSAQPARG